MRYSVFNAQNAFFHSLATTFCVTHSIGHYRTASTSLQKMNGSIVVCCSNFILFCRFSEQLASMITVVLQNQTITSFATYGQHSYCALHSKYGQMSGTVRELIHMLGTNHLTKKEQHDSKKSN